MEAAIDRLPTDGQNAAGVSTEMVTWYVYVQPDYPYWPTWTLLLSSVTVAVALPANSWILYRGLTQRQLRHSSFHVLLMNHAVANFIACFAHAIRILRSAEEIYIEVLDYELCTVWAVVLCCVCCVTLFANALIAVNRALACYPYLVASRKLRTRPAVLVAIIVTWIFFLGLLILPVVLDLESLNALFFCSDESWYDDYGHYAFLSERNSLIQSSQVFVRAACGLSGTATFLICVLSYGAIIHYLFCGREHLGSASKQRKKEKLQALILIVVIFVILLCCWLPLLVVLLWRPSLLDEHDVLLWLPMLDAAAIPLVYIVSMPAYRPRLRLESQISPTRTKTGPEATPI